MGRTDERQTANLLSAAGDVGHLLYLSIVGIDAIDYGYYRRKLACERLIEAGTVPWTIQRATQFHQLLATVFGALDRLPWAPLPLGFRCQPVAAAEVAQRVAALVEGGPVGRAPDLGGPEVSTLGELAECGGSARAGPPGWSTSPCPAPWPGRSKTGAPRAPSTPKAARPGSSSSRSGAAWPADHRGRRPGRITCRRGRARDHPL